MNEIQYFNVLSPLTNQTAKVKFCLFSAVSVFSLNSKLFMFHSYFQQVAVKLRLDPDQWGAPCMVAPVSSLVDIAYSNRHLLIMVSSIFVVSLGTLYIYVAFIQPNMRPPAQPFLQSGN